MSGDRGTQTKQQKPAMGRKAQTRNCLKRAAGPQDELCLPFLGHHQISRHGRHLVFVADVLGERLEGFPTFVVTVSPFHDGFAEAVGDPVGVTVRYNPPKPQLLKALP